MEKIRLGILGTGRIVARVMTDMHNAENITLTAVASRDLGRAQQTAVKYGIPNAYGSYLELAESPQVDLVYIATPHPFHAEQAILMMEHGKHVLCEKPMTMNLAQLLPMVECARRNKVFLMEAMWTRFVPARMEAMQLIRSGVIGKVQHIYGQFSWHNPAHDTEDRLLNPALAGGALLDLGVYPLMGITEILGWEPTSVQAVASVTAQGVDMRTAVQMQFADGATAQLMCGMDACSNNTMIIYGTKGYLELPEFWHPYEFTLHLNSEDAKPYAFKPENEGHHYEFDHAAQCIRSGLTESPVVTLDESVAISRLCTEIRSSIGVRYPGK